MVYVRMNFDLSSSAGVVDQAEFGIYGVLTWTPGDDGAWTDVLQALATAGRGEWAGSFPKTLMSPGLSLNSCKATQQSTSGHALLVAQDSSEGGSWAGSASQSLPWEVAIVISTYSYPRGSFVPNARSRRGRAYLGPLGSNILISSLTGEISITDAETLRDAFGDWLSALAGNIFGDSDHRFVPSILSRHLVQSFPITQLSVDNKLDSQRRRQKTLPAVINSVDWP